MTNPSPLSQRLIQAADTVEEFNRSLPEIYPPDYSWSPSELRREAGHLEEEEREAAERERKECPGYAWLGSWTCCNDCGQPYWEHTYFAKLAEGSGPFDDEWDYVLISEEAKARVRARVLGTPA